MDDDYDHFKLRHDLSLCELLPNEHRPCQAAGYSRCCLCFAVQRFEAV